MESLAQFIQNTFPETRVIEQESDEVQTTLSIPGIPGYIRVTESGFTMTHNNVIPASLSLCVLTAMRNK